MSKFSASDAAFVGFRLVREHPRTVAVWAVLMTLLSLVSSILTIMLAGPQLTAFMEMNTQNTASPEEMLAAMGGLAPLMGVSLVYSLALYAVMLAAVNRMALRPDDSRSAYLRLGRDELRQAGTLILVNLLMLGVYIGAVLVIAIVVGVAVAASGGGAMTGLVGLITFVGVACLLIYMAVRLSLAAAITFDTGKVSVRASWAMTKGHVGALLGAYLLAAVMAVIVYVLIMTIVAAIGAIASGGITGLSGLFEPDMTSLAAFFTPIGVARAVFAGGISVLTSLIMLSPAPEIYRMLKADGAVAVDSSATQ
jgi:hypothetical protein